MDSPNSISSLSCTAHTKPHGHQLSAGERFNGVEARSFPSTHAIFSVRQLFSLPWRRNLLALSRVPSDSMHGKFQLPILPASSFNATALDMSSTCVSSPNAQETVPPNRTVAYSMQNRVVIPSVSLMQLTIGQPSQREAPILAPLLDFQSTNSNIPTPMGLFIGNVPMQPNGLPDKFVESFNKSSRKTLHLVPPSTQNGDVIVRPTLEMIKLRHLPIEYWTDDGLGIVASEVGKPLYPDAITKARTRLDFACICILLDISSKPPRHVIIMARKEDGGEVPCKVDVEYEWIPPKCVKCMCLGHSTGSCSMTKTTMKLPVAVFVQKSIVNHDKLSSTKVSIPQPRALEIVEEVAEPTTSHELSNPIPMITAKGPKKRSPQMVLHDKCECLEREGSQPPDHQV
ncbi:UNVERIFIED_CONTAM: hypothetical protein Slati_3482000 [Sesamum latifolium]|uniref:DUF4283 domain-containing protein n=1 Tax=Sesamum latifolium TaxID=2727402 RepID=A0AAW2UMD7_9LAMI